MIVENKTHISVSTRKDDFMRITARMLSMSNCRTNSSVYARKTVKSQGISKYKRPLTVSSTRTRQTVNTSTSVDKYIKLGEEAELLRSSTEILNSSSKSSIFDNARSTGSKDTLLGQAKQMVNSFNNTMSGLKSETSSLNRVYRQMMENAATESSEALSAIGITVNQDRTLRIDETKLNRASIDEIEAALGSKSGFTTRVSSLAENVSKNAVTTATNLSSTMNSYGVPGVSYNPYTGFNYGNANYLAALLSGTSRFNFWV